MEHLRRRLLDLFETWGYEFVMPPLIEYLESLLVGASRETVKSRLRYAVGKLRHALQDLL